MQDQYTFFGTCTGKTKKGTPCRHTSVYANGRCKQHGGDSSAYMVLVHERIAEKQRRRLERWRRKFLRMGIELKNESNENG